MKSKSAVTGKYTKASGADPKTTFKSDDYPARMLRKLVRMHDGNGLYFMDRLPVDALKLIANIKRRMNWK